MNFILHLLLSITIGNATVSFLCIVDGLHITVSNTALLSVTMEIQEVCFLCTVILLQNISSYCQH